MQKAYYALEFFFSAIQKNRGVRLEAPPAFGLIK